MYVCESERDGDGGRGKEEREDDTASEDMGMALYLKPFLK